MARSIGDLAPNRGKDAAEEVAGLFPAVMAKRLGLSPPTRCGDVVKKGQWYSLAGDG